MIKVSIKRTRKTGNTLVPLWLVVRKCYFRNKKKQNGETKMRLNQKTKVKNRGTKTALLTHFRTAHRCSNVTKIESINYISNTNDSYN